MAIKNEVVDELLKDADPKKVFSSEGLLAEIKKALAERMLNAEMDQHLDAEAVAAGEPSGNHRNGYSKKTVTTDTSQVELDIPRDRRGTFEPQLIAKYQRRFPGFDDKIISMYARGMSVRDIQGHLRELYGIEASPQLISTVTDAVSRRSAAGRGGLWTRSTRSSFSTPCGSRCEMRERFGTRPCTSRSASRRTAARTCWASGSSRPRAPSSGCGS